MNFNGKEGINMLSMLFCKYNGGGIITAQESGQSAKMSGEGITFNEDLYYNNKFYRQIADYISQIQGYDTSWDSTLAEIVEVYNRQKERYEALSNEGQYFPPELIAAIHYRENAEDYLSGDFGVYLHNGDLLGTNSLKYPKPDFLEKISLMKLL